MSALNDINNYSSPAYYPRQEYFVKNIVHRHQYIGTIKASTN